VPSSFESIVRKALEKKPERRPQSMAELADALRKSQTTLPTGTLRETLFVTEHSGKLEETFGDRTSKLRNFFGLQGSGTLWMSHLTRIGRMKQREADQKTLEQVSNVTRVEETAPPESTLQSTLVMRGPLQTLKEWTNPGKIISTIAIVAAIAVALVVYLEWDSGNQKVITRSPKKPADIAAPVQLPPSPVQDHSPVSAFMSLEVRPEKSQLSIGENIRLRVFGKDLNGHEVELTKGISWESRNKRVISVSAVGRAEAIREGQAKVVAYYPGLASTPVTLSVRVFSSKGGVSELPSEKKNQLVEIGDLLKGAQIDMDNGDYENASVKLRKAAELDPNNPEIRERRKKNQGACIAERDVRRPELKCDM